jgi:hypothetical protein
MSCSPDILNQDISHNNSHRAQYTAPIIFTQENEPLKNNGRALSFPSNAQYVEGQYCKRNYCF